MKILLVDFGSTYTKLVAVDTATAEILATASAITTIHTNVLDGYYEALNKLSCGQNFDKIAACSSAAGGLSMTAIGLVEELTVEAAKRACLGAGAKLTSVYSNKLSEKELLQISKNPGDILLLCGGTDGGNSDCVLHNAQMLSKITIDCPIIYAGNKTCAKEVGEFLKDKQVIYCNNVMPALNKLSVNAAQEAIRELFIKEIINAKGMSEVSEMIGKIVMPTPKAVQKALVLLAKGYKNESGLGDLLLVDIGGATTDVHSICKGFPSKVEVTLKGLEEPFAKRTVEGDLGMRYSLKSMYENLGEEILFAYFDDSVNIAEEVEKRNKTIEYLPTTVDENEIETSFARACVDTSISRHVGRIESIYTPLGQMHYQIGKDLSEIKVVIGTGGVIVNNEKAINALRDVAYQTRHLNELRPKNPDYFVDRNYILSAMGILSEIDPLVALKIMKKNLLEVTNDFK